MIREHIVKPFTRSAKWRATRKKFLRTHPRCAVCSLTRELEVHHIKPVRLYPELELDLNNLVTLCRRHHFNIGHLENWKSYNPSLKLSIVFFRELLHGKIC